MKAIKTIQVGGKAWTLGKYSPSVGLRHLQKLQSLIGPGLSGLLRGVKLTKGAKLGDSVDGGALALLIAGVSDRLTDPELVPFLVQLLEDASVRCDGAAVTAETFDAVLSGFDDPYDVTGRVVKETLVHNYAAFLGKLTAGLSGLGELVASSGQG